MNSVNKVKDHIDPTIVVSAVAASIVIGIGVWVARRAGMGTVATVVKGG
ncbi:hypothetical protein HBA55_34510 [Pseudomaricurvus alkylphenolicus]|nr:hypothetical protein [Pseudomaricurvus alkylphenolicus]NIB44744.1 hypothetical protein [Pseudomaricurvus alkylphenolicus]